MKDHPIPAGRNHHFFAVQLNWLLVSRGT